MAPPADNPDTFRTKLLLLFVPLVLAGNLVAESQIHEMMREDKEQEAVLRLRNSFCAILNTLSLDDLEAIRRRIAATRFTSAFTRWITRILDAQRVPHTPKWILHKIINNRFYFGINIQRADVEPFIVYPERGLSARSRKKFSQYGRFQDDQGEWFDHISPILNRAGKVIYLLELYSSDETMVADREAAARAGRMVGGTGLLLFMVILVFSFLLFTQPLRRW